MKKIKLIDFLDFVNFRYATDRDEYDTKIIRIYYPDKDDLSFSKMYDRNRYFEYGVYDFSVDTRKRLIQTINPWILNCYVLDISSNENILEITVTEESEIEDFNIDSMQYDLEGYNNNKINKIFVCSPLSGDNMEENIEKAKEHCKGISLMGYLPIAPHLYFTQFLNDDNEAERRLGMDLGLRLLAECDEIWVYNEDGISAGMNEEIEMAKRLNIPIKYSVVD